MRALVITLAFALSTMTVTTAAMATDNSTKEQSFCEGFEGAMASNLDVYNSLNVKIKGCESDQFTQLISNDYSYSPDKSMIDIKALLLKLFGVKNN